MRSARWELHHAESAAVLAGRAPGSIDAVCTDPPGGTSYLGHAWDTDHGGRDAWVAVHAPLFAGCRVAAKPGAWGIFWAEPRTSHWTAWALEDGGWEVVDVATHLQAQGLRKSKSSLAPAADHWILARTPGPLRDLHAEAGARWPKNATPECACATTAHDPGCPVALLDAQSGVRRSGAMKAGTVRAPSKSYSGRWAGGATTRAFAASAGGASRFYFCARVKGAARKRNPHPTPKSPEICAYLLGLVARPGDLVLDPFAGSGQIGVAALQLGMRYCGVERDAAYVAFARGELAAACL